MQLRDYSTEALAYLGDCVIELCVRRYLVVTAELTTSGHLNEGALKFVRAAAQAKAMERLLPVLTGEETAVFHRGRNIGHTNRPKNATVTEYRSATGMETLFGWLFLQGDQARIDELFQTGYGADPL